MQKRKVEHGIMRNMRTLPPIELAKITRDEALQGLVTIASLAGTCGLVDDLFVSFDGYWAASYACKVLNIPPPQLPE